MRWSTQSFTIGALAEVFHDYFTSFAGSSGCVGYIAGDSDGASYANILNNVYLRSARSLI